MVGVGMGVTIATGGIGVGPYLAGTGAVGGMSMALDPKVRHSLATGDWVGTMGHGSYHTPFIGNGRNAWDAWQMGKPWSAAGHAGLFGVEAWGVRSAGKVRGTVRGGGKIKMVDKGKLGKVSIDTIDKNVMIFSVKKGNYNVEAITHFEIKDNKLFLNQLHLEGAAAGKVGREALWEMAKDLGKQHNVKEVIIQGGRRTTGKYKGKMPSQVIVKVD